MGQDGKFFKKPTPVLGVQMKEPFAVTASWGRLEGKPERLTVTPDLRAKLDAMRARVPKD